jgi:hypothetical protein
MANGELVLCVQHRFQVWAKCARKNFNDARDSVDCVDALERSEIEKYAAIEGN